MYSFIKPLLFKIEPETAHNIAIKSLKLNCFPSSFFKIENEELLKIKLFGKTFSNPIGLAAGFDKSAEVYNTIFKFGFGFVPAGTVHVPVSYAKSLMYGIHSKYTTMLIRASQYH